MILGKFSLDLKKQTENVWLNNKINCWQENRCSNVSSRTSVCELCGNVYKNM